MYAISCFVCSIGLRPRLCLPSHRHNFIFVLLPDSRSNRWTTFLRTPPPPPRSCNFRFTRTARSTLTWLPPVRLGVKWDRIMFCNLLRVVGGRELSPLFLFCSMVEYFPTALFNSVYSTRCSTLGCAFIGRLCLYQYTVCGPLPESWATLTVTPPDRPEQRLEAAGGAGCASGPSAVVCDPQLIYLFIYFFYFVFFCCHPFFPSPPPRNPPQCFDARLCVHCKPLR